MTGTPLVIAVEGIDGSGKNTLATVLQASLSAQGIAVSRVAFPRYGQRPWGQLITDILSGRAHGLSESIEGTALAFAADRHAWRQETDWTADCVWIVDRYIASNVAYGCSRLRTIGGAPEKFEQWILELELSLFGLPRPTLQILLDISPEVPQKRMESRRPMDTFEQSRSLQEQAAAEYRRMADEAVMGAWHVVSFGEEASADHVYAAVAPKVQTILGM